jgi:CRP-like cAMP-binding protein
VAALRDSKLTFVSRATFDVFVRESPELCRQLMVLLAWRLRATNEALTATNFLSVKGRVASALPQLAESFGEDVGSGRMLVRQKASQSDLAAMAGVARENVSRLLTDWTNSCSLSRLAGYYCIENKKAFQKE